MRAASVAGLVLASLIKLAKAEDLLFYNDMLYNEYKEATTTLGYTAHIASDAEWRSYTTADFAKYKAIIVPDPNCGTIDKIKYLEDTKAVWSPAVTGNVILIGTDPTYHSASQSGAIDLIDDSIRFAASGTKGTGLYFSLSCYYDSGDITTINALSEFGTFYVRGKLACYNDAHLVANAPELKSLNDDSIANWSCSVHEVFTEFPRLGVEPGTDGFESFAIARNATGDGEESYADGSSGIPYIIARGAIPVGCGDGKIEDAYGEECDNGKDANGTPGNPCSTSCKCYYGVASPGVCKLSNTTSSSSSMSSSSTVVSNSRSVPTGTSDECTTDTVSSTALPSTSANSTLPSSTPPETTTASAPSSAELTSASPASSTAPDVTTVTAAPSGPSAPAPGLPWSSVVPSNSSDPAAGPSPPVTVTASAGGSDPSAPSAPASEPSSPGTPPSTTIVTTIDGPTPTVITVIATADPPLSAESGSAPPPPVTIVTTIDGPVPSVITIIADPPLATHPMSMPPPSVPGAPSASGPSYVTSATTIGAPDSGPSAAPGSPDSTTVLTVAGPGAGGPGPSVPAIPPLPSSGPVSASPSSVTVLTSAAGDSSDPAAPAATSVVAGSPDNPPLSTETSIHTVFSTAPGGASPSNPAGESPSTAAASAPADASSGALPVPGAPTSVVTSVNTISAPGSGTSSRPGNYSGSATPIPTGSLANPVPGGSASGTAGGPSAASSSEASLSALHSGTPSSDASETNTAAGSVGSGSAAPTSTLTSGSGAAPTSGGSTNTAGSGAGAPSASASSSAGGIPSNGTASGVPTSSAPGAGPTGSLISNSTGLSTAVSASDTGSLSAISAPTSLPGNPSVSGSAGSISAADTTHTASQTDGPSISKNGSMFTVLTSGGSGTALPTTLATTTLPSGSGSTCDAYIGIEVIEFIEITEVCPEGATVTETITTCLSTMTRPICRTSTPGYPCYPCMGLTPSAGDIATVTRSTCTSSTPLTTTITAQPCHSCAATTYTTTSLPGLTPGGGCKDCAPYNSGPLTIPSSTTLTLDATATATVRISAPGECHDCPDTAPTDTPQQSGGVPNIPGTVGGSSGPAQTTLASPGGGDSGSGPTVVPGNPGLPNTTGGNGNEYGSAPPGAGGPTPTTIATQQPPATVPSKSAVPSYVTVAGGPRGVVWELGAGVAAAVVWALMMF